MSIISGTTGFGIDIAKFKKLDIDPANLRKATAEEMAEFEKIREMQYTTISNLDELQNHVSQKIYAEVKVNGQTIAKVYNGGTSETSNAYGAKINKIIEDLDSKLTGPQGAQERAEAIAKAFGGTVVKAGTAVTQTEYLATPAFKPEYKVDYEAMERDRARVEGRVSTPQTQVDAQTLATDEAGGKNAVDEFFAFTSMSWEEKVRALILKNLGLDEDSLAAMSPEDREKIEEKIEAKIKEKIDEEFEKKTGMPAGTATLSTTT